MTLDEIKNMIKDDADVNIHKLDEESIKAISLHSKYLVLWQEEKTKLLALTQLLKNKKRERVNYYMGRASDEVYESSPLNLKIPRQDLDFYLDSDEELSAIQLKVSNCQNKVDLLKMFIDQNINLRSFHIKNAIAFMTWREAS